MPTGYHIFLNFTSDYLLPIKTMKKYLNIYKVVLAGSYHAVELLIFATTSADSKNNDLNIGLYKYIKAL